MSVREYVGARYVPIVMGEWDKTRTYEPLMVVTHQGNSYTSRQYVPAGIDIANESYWILSANYNAQVDAYRKEVQALDGRVNANAHAIETETGNRTAAVNELQTNIANEKTRAEGAEQTLQAALNHINLAKFVHDLSNIDDDFAKACTAALNENKTLFIPNGDYYHNNVLTVPAELTVVGESWNAILHGTSVNNQAIVLNDNACISNLALQNAQSERSSTDMTVGLLVNGNYVNINKVYIDKTNSAGIKVNHSKGTRIENCLIKNTLADGIHFTDECDTCYAVGNSLYNIGDDAISAVGYKKNAGPCKNMYFINNYVNTNEARALTMIGVDNGVMDGNICLNYKAAAVYFSSEPSSYNLYDSHNVVISNSYYESNRASYIANVSLDEINSLTVSNCIFKSDIKATLNFINHGKWIGNTFYNANLNDLGYGEISDCTFIDCQGFYISPKMYDTVKGKNVLIGNHIKSADAKTAQTVIYHLVDGLIANNIFVLNENETPPRITNSTAIVSNTGYIKDTNEVQRIGINSDSDTYKANCDWIIDKPSIANIKAFAQSFGNTNLWFAHDPKKLCINYDGKIYSIALTEEA